MSLLPRLADKIVISFSLSVFVCVSGLGLRDDLLVPVVSLLQLDLWDCWLQEQVQEGGDPGQGQRPALPQEAGETEEMSPGRLSSG